MQFKILIAAVAASAFTGVLAAPSPNNNIVAREQNAKQAEMTQLSDLAKQEGQLYQQINEKFGAKYLELKQQNQDNKVPSLDEVKALKEHMQKQKQKRDAAPEADPEASGIDIGIGFDWGYGCGWQNWFPFSTYGWLYDYNWCNYYTGFGYHNVQFGYAAGYYW